MSQPLVKCKRVFQALIKLAVEELCETADSLIAPVRLGVARPSAPFTLASTTIDVINVSVTFILLVLLKYVFSVSNPRYFQNIS
jgi:E3 ubiquitin-protein ligase EDD1